MARPERYLLLYDAETPAAFESDTYYARLGDPTEMSRAILPKFRNTWRTVCSVERRRGDGIAWQSGPGRAILCRSMRWPPSRRRASIS